MSVPLPKTIGRYEVQGELGRGMMGVVYRAMDPVLGRTVAVKTVHLAFATSEEQRRSFEERFVSEAKVAGSLSHPGIVTVHDVGRDPATGTLYIAMELLEGRTLSQRMAEGRVPWRESLAIVARLAEALHHAHGQAVVHRDVKPANIILLPDGQPKLMDFGVAKVPASDLTAAGEFFGTPSYMSPEQTLGHGVDGRSDLFSLGCVLYLLVTGRKAFEGPSVPTVMALVAHKDPDPPTTVVPDLPPEIDYLVSRALAKIPADRYPDGQTFAEDLLDVAEGRRPRHRSGWHRAGMRSPDSTLPGPAPAPRGRRVLLGLGVGALALVGLAGGLAFGLKRGGAVFAPPPSRLEVSFEHGSKSGSLRLWVDDALVLEAPLESEVTSKVLVFERRKGVLRRELEVAPGDRVIRVEVEEGDASLSKRIGGTFESGVLRRLRVSKSGLLKKELTLEWSAP